MKLALSLALLLLLAPASAAVAAPRPNILVVMTDDQPTNGMMSVMPETRRRLGRQGVTYTEMHASTPKCCPSRASFMTGLYVHNHHVISNASAGALNHKLTIQHFLHRRGYRTAIFGKFLNSWPAEVDPPYFDNWAITNGGYYDAFWNIDGHVDTKHRYTTDLISDKTVRFIRDRDKKRDEQPWLAWVTPSAPHTPSTPPRRYRDARLPSFPLTPAMQETDISDKPSFLDDARHAPEVIEQVRDDGRRSLMAVDDMVGRLLDELKRLHEVDNTLVVFTSDNGFLLGEHGGLAGKDLPYPASTGVPLIIRWPGHFRKGRTTSRFVENIDVATTILDAAGVKRETDGHSLLGPGRRHVIYTESRGARSEDGARSLPPFRSLRTKSYRFAEYYRAGTYDVIAREYYDLRTDPWELDNRISELSPERTAELSARLAQYGTCKGRSCP